MKKTVKKLRLSVDTVAVLSGTQLGQAVGGAYTDSPGCIETRPASFCICATKHMCSINC